MQGGGLIAEQPAAAGATFSAMTYNILAKSLGSNCVPWVMSGQHACVGAVCAAVCVCCCCVCVRVLLYVAAVGHVR